MSESAAVTAEFDQTEPQPASLVDEDIGQAHITLRPAVFIIEWMERIGHFVANSNIFGLTAHR